MGPTRVPCPSAMGVSSSHSVVYVGNAQSSGVKVMTRVYTMGRLTPLLQEETLPRDERRTRIFSSVSSQTRRSVKTAYLCLVRLLQFRRTRSCGRISRRSTIAHPLQSCAHTFVIRPGKDRRKESKHLESLRVFPRRAKEREQYVRHQPAVDARICGSAAQTAQSLHEMFVDNYS